MGTLLKKAVVVAQLATLLLPLSDILGSNPVNGNFYRFAVNCLHKKTKINKKRGMEWSIT